MSINLSIEISDELSQLAEARARSEGTTLTEVLRRRLVEFATGQNDQPRLNNSSAKSGARFLKLAEVDPNYRLSPEEVQAGLESLASLDELAEEIAQITAGQKIDAVELVREGRREF